MSIKPKARIIAYYLPQFHPIPENDAWWGEGFTEWTNVRKAKPLFKGHQQPKIPSTLGYYDLTDSQTRQEQANLAAAAGVEGFCYWHYYFGNGKRLLEKPFDAVLESGKPKFPFCLGWANHSWYKKTFTDQRRDILLIEQLYPGKDDYIQHFRLLQKAFTDPRYMTIGGKPIFVIFDPFHFKDFQAFKAMWNELASEIGLPGFAFVGYCLKDADAQNVKDMGYDYVNINRLNAYIDELSCVQKKYIAFKRRLLKRGKFTKYAHASKFFTSKLDKEDWVIPSLLPNWDHSPRSGRKYHNLFGSTPALFKDHVLKVMKMISHKNEEEKLVFLKSWNEWGEGNYMEPDEEFGNAYLDALSEAVVENKKSGD